MYIAHSHRWSHSHSLEYPSGYKRAAENTSGGGRKTREAPKRLGNTPSSLYRSPFSPLSTKNQRPRKIYISLATATNSRFLIPDLVEKRDRPIKAGFTSGEAFPSRLSTFWRLQFEITHHILARITQRVLCILAVVLRILYELYIEPTYPSIARPHAERASETEITVHTTRIHRSTHY